MKKISKFLTFLFMLSSVICFAGKDPNAAVCLIVEGTFENAFDHDRRPCRVEVLRNGQVLDTLILTRFKKRFWYPFERDCCYTLRITKPGFVPMTVAIDTRITENQDALHQFVFSARLITEKRARTFNQEALHLPFAVIRFNDSKKTFYYDEEYTDSLKTQLV